MALDHTIMTAMYTPGPIKGAALKIQQGGHSSIQTNQDVTQLASYFTNARRAALVWNGNIYLFLGHSASSGNGFWKYNPILDKISLSSYTGYNETMIPLFDRIGFAASGDFGWGFSPEDRRHQAGTLTGHLSDFATFGGDVMMLDWSNSRLTPWAYPFSAAPAPGPALPDPTSKHVCELAGDFYVVHINDAAGTLDLHKYVGGSLPIVGTPTSHAGLNNYDPTSADYSVLFKFNGKLFLLVCASTSGIQMMRLFEFNISTGGSVEQNAYLPAAWTVNGSGSQRLMEVRDSITPNEQVFLIHYEYQTGGWECYEFQEGAFIAVDSGTEALLGGGAVVFDPDAKGAQIKYAWDSTPSSYVRSDVEVYDLKSNGSVDIDPRYRWNKAEPPPYPQCTGKAPYDVVTGLASAPVQSALSDLDDDFEDGFLDEDLWERVTLAFLDDSEDYGHGIQNGLRVGTVAFENNGAVRFGRASESWETDQGCGIRSKSRVDGAFQIDFTIADPENLTAASGSLNGYLLMGLVRVSVNEGFGFVVWRSSTGPQVKVFGIYMAPDSSVVKSAEFNAADGDVIRIVRDGANVWALTHDPAGANNDITPVGGANYSGQVEVVMGCKPYNASSWVLTGTPVGSEPGIKDIAFSGAGSPGLYQGGQTHRFDWDHLTDLGAGQNGSAELFVDTQRT